MKIAILGTRGIPNNYGGFEQCAEFLSVGLVERGHEVTVYSPHFHSYKETKFKHVTIIKKEVLKTFLVFQQPILFMIIYVLKMR